MTNRSSFRTLALATCSVAAVSLFASSGLAQASDNCANAPVVGSGSFPFDLNGATADGTQTCGFPTTGPDVWYRYNATGNGVVFVDTCGSGFDSMLAVFDGCGGVQLACNDDSQCNGVFTAQSNVQFNVVAGGSYLIRISQFGSSSGATGTGNVNIVANVGSGPLNDRCVGATQIGVGSFPFDNTLAAADAEDGPAASCGFGGDGGSKDVFYRFTSPTSGSATIDTCGSFDTILQALSGCGGTEIACNDDACGLSSRIVFDVSAGSSYIIRISGYQGASGAGNLTVSVAQGNTPGDFCSTAFPAAGPGTYDFDTTAATIDAAATCAGNGSGSQWFRYVASSSAFATIQTCGTASFDTVLAAFDSCGGAQLACNDDSCGLQSRIGFQATAGEDYFIRISGFGAAVGAGQIVITEAQPSTNDLCVNATVAVDGNNAFDNTAAGTDGAPASCGFGGAPGVNDVWFRYTATSAGDLIAATCGSGLDTIVSIYDTCGGTELGCNDDAGPLSACPNTLQSAARAAVTAGQQVIIRVAAWNAAAAGVGNLNISIQAPLVSCVTPPPGATSEDEACGDDTNGGCNNPTQSFFELSPGAVTIAGTGWAANNVRDTDWYRITATASTRIDATLQADFPAVLFLVTGVATCQGIAVTQNAPAPNRCTDIASFSTVVPAGSYAVFVAPSFFDGFPCGTVNNYVLTVNSVAVGACCTTEGCSIKSSAECASIGGNYLGDDSNCSNGSSYNGAEVTTTAFEDVTATGTALALTDDSFQVVDIGFDFSFFGDSFTQVSVASNGYLQFGGSSSIFTNTAIPTAANPNNCAYGLWDDLDPGAGGTITVATVGTAPNRRFIAQYQDVAQFGGGAPVTFEMILYEGSNNIEYVYGNIPEDVAGDYTVGVENADGTVAKVVDSATLGTGNTGRLFTPTAPTGGCNATCAPDFNGDGSLDPDDLSDYITAFFSQPPSPAADYNGDGTVDPDDLSDYITAFFAGC